MERDVIKFRNELLGEVAAIEQRILDGKFPTYDTYQRQCGVAEGLKRSLDLFEQFIEVEDLAEI